MNNSEANDHNDHDHGKGICIAVAAFLVLLQFFIVSKHDVVS